ncbi:MAG: hypothetical protein ABIJ09_01730 [Pseudomonadota bacterium]
MRLRDLSLLVLALVIALAQVGCARCPYETQCEGNILKFCTLGVDQLLGDPSTGEMTCTAPNPVCVNLDERTAQCTMTGEADCEDSLEPACVDGSVVRCASRYRVAEDCAGHGNGCFVVDSAPRCAMDPLTTCDRTQFTSHCAEQSLITCVDGYETSRLCSHDRAESTCQDYSSDAGQSAYCD